MQEADNGDLILIQGQLDKFIDVEEQRLALERARVQLELVLIAEGPPVTRKVRSACWGVWRVLTGEGEAQPCDSRLPGLMG